MSKLKIEIEADFACPYCYIGTPQLKSVLKNSAYADKVDLIWNGIEWDPKLTKEPVGISYLKYYNDSESTLKQITESANAAGLPLNYEDIVITSTADALRVTKFAEKYNLQNETAEAFYKAYSAKSNLKAVQKRLSLFLHLKYMKPNDQKIWLNCFLLMLPVMLWNILLANLLPYEFQPGTFEHNIPTFICYGENISRFLLFGLTLIMPLKLETKIQRKGLMLYAMGLLLYFSSWLFLILFPYSQWSNHILVFMAPSYTPLFWLTGIGLIGNSFYFNLSYKKWYFFFISIVFLIFHNLHTLTIFNRIYS